jgi:hypothetical protein
VCKCFFFTQRHKVPKAHEVIVPASRGYLPNRFFVNLRVLNASCVNVFSYTKDTKFRRHMNWQSSEGSRSGCSCRQVYLPNRFFVNLRVLNASCVNVFSYSNTQSSEGSRSGCSCLQGYLPNRFFVNLRVLNASCVNVFSSHKDIKFHQIALCYKLQTKNFFNRSRQGARKPPMFNAQIGAQLQTTIYKLCLGWCLHQPFTRKE